MRYIGTISKTNKVNLVLMVNRTNMLENMITMLLTKYVRLLLIADFALFTSELNRLTNSPDLYF